MIEYNYICIYNIIYNIYIYIYMYNYMYICYIYHVSEVYITHIDR